MKSGKKLTFSDIVGLCKLIWFGLTIIGLIIMLISEQVGSVIIGIGIPFCLFVGLSNLIYQFKSNKRKN
jgi:hypothetical protein